MEPDFKVDDDHWQEWASRRRRRLSKPGYETISDYLRDSEKFSSQRIGIRVMQLITAPSFGPYVSYELFQQTQFGENMQKPHRNLLIRTTWRLDLELAQRQQNPPVEKMYFSKPHLEYQHTVLPSDVADGVFTALKQTIPIWFDLGAELDYMGNDGTSYELALGGSFLGARYQWWSYKPDGWQPLYDAFDKAATTFDTYLT